MITQNADVIVSIPKYYNEMMYKILIIFCLLLSEISSFGQCDNSIQPTHNAKVGYKSRGNRCEGLYSAKVGAPSLEIAGLTIGILSYNLEKTESLEITNSTGADLHIRSSAIPIDTYYRMDAFLENGQTLKWDIEDVLYELNLPSNSLGVYGWIGPDENNKTYVPVKPVSSIYDETDTTIYLVVRPSSKVLNIIYNYATIEQNQGKDEHINGSFGSGQPIVIKLPADLHGTYIIEIKALLVSKPDWVSRKFRISIQ